MRMLVATFQSAPSRSNRKKILLAIRRKASVSHVVHEQALCFRRCLPALSSNQKCIDLLQKFASRTTVVKQI